LNWQVFCVAVQAPAMHCCPLAQSLEAVHGHGPLDPPHAWQWLATHTWPLVQSAFVVQPFGVHVPATQRSPAVVQSLCCVHGHAAWPLPPHASHLFATHVLPLPQSVLVVHSIGAPPSAPGAPQTPA
jgi:hypothetical protein